MDGEYLKIMEGCMARTTCAAGRLNGIGPFHCLFIQRALVILSMLCKPSARQTNHDVHTRQAGVYLIELPCCKLVIFRLQTNFYVELYIPLPPASKKEQLQNLAAP